MEPLNNDKRIRGKEAMDRLVGQLARIKKTRTTVTIGALAINALIYFGLLALFKGDTDKTVRVYTNSFQYQCVAWVAWFMLPYFLRMEAKQDVGMAMGHDSVDLMDKIDEAVATRTARFDEILSMTKAELEQIKAGSHPILEDLKKCAREELDKLRQEIRGQKSSTERELSEALEEGEREAAAAGNGHPELEAVAAPKGGPELEAQTSRCARCGCLRTHCTCGSLTH